MSVVTVQQMADRVAGLLEERLRVKGATLEDKLDRAEHRLPRKVRAAVGSLAQATYMIRNPKLRHQVDDESVAVAYDICLRYLNTISPRATRMNLIIDIAARIASVLVCCRGVVRPGALLARDALSAWGPTESKAIGPKAAIVPATGLAGAKPRGLS